jgi:FkbM family methyltransferase
MNVRKVLAALGIGAMTVALSYYVIRDARQAFRMPLVLNVNVPCEEHSSGYRKYQTPIGIICAERDVRDGIKRTLIEGMLWEPDVVELLGRLVRPDSIAIDVGAHIGSHTLTMARRVGPKGMVVAFEPQTKRYEELLGNLALNAINNVRAEFAALGDAPALITMGPAIDVCEGLTAVGQGGNRVQLRTLDSYELTNVSLIKIDVEGFEVKVLAGARQTLSRQRPAVIIEINAGNLVAVRRFFEDLGYDVQALAGSNYLAQPRPHKEAPSP